MCTVTFIPSRNHIFLTSNRDEKKVRATAINPRVYEFSTGRLLFPKDADAGGTWVSAHENGNAVVFLNGGTVAHTPKPPYRKSRGLILLDLINDEHPFEAFRAIDLNGIEPFTAIVWDDGELYECRWDGSNRHVYPRDTASPHIWSSVTLYTPEVISQRESWFAEWLAVNPNPTQEEILSFHQFGGNGDTWNGFKMDRNGETFTVSITSLNLGGAQTFMYYLDLKNNRTEISEFAVEKNTVVLK
jgi:hypothetical protein